MGHERTRRAVLSKTRGLIRFMTRVGRVTFGDFDIRPNRAGIDYTVVTVHFPSI
jgi:hypothetical protein